MREFYFMKEDGFPMTDRLVSVATGYAAYDSIRSLASLLEKEVTGLRVLVYPIENKFFGPEITVTGLLTGQDIAEQLASKELGEHLYISRSSLRAEGDLFLCGMSLDELSEALGVPVTPIENNGMDLLHAFLGDEEGSL